MAKDVTGQDWAKIEADYRAGVKSLRQVAGEYGITEGAIRKRAKKEEWTRDLKAKIRSRADDIVRRDALHETLVRKNEVRKLERVAYCVPEREIVEANAEQQVLIRREQRSDITRGRRLLTRVLVELEEQMDNLPVLQDLGEIMLNPDEKGQDKLNEAYRRVISLGGRIGNLKTVAETMKTLVPLERQAFGIEDRPQERGLEDVLEEMGQ